MDGIRVGAAGKARRYRRFWEVGAALLLLGLVFACGAAYWYRWSLDQELKQALKLYNLEAVIALVERGADPNVYSMHGLSPLMIAASSGTPDDVKLLLRRGAHVHGEPGKPDALAYAVAAGDEERVRILLDHGADPNHRSILPSTLSRAVETGREPVIDLLLKRGARVAGDKNIPAAAIYTDNLKLLRRMLELGARMADCPDAATLAVETQNIRMVRYVVAQGASLGRRGPHGWSPLTRAVGLRYFDIAAFLLAHGADPNMPDGKGMTPMKWARNGLGSPRLIRLLRQSSARE